MSKARLNKLLLHACIDHATWQGNLRGERGPDLGRIEQLIGEGADVNMSFNRNPLTHHCAFHSQTALMILLLERGANPNSKSSDPYAGPLIARCTSMPDVCFELVERGANIEAVNAQGHTPLRTVCEGFLKISTLPLIALGADKAHFVSYNPDMEDAVKLSPAEAAAACGMTRRVLQLLEGAGAGRELDRIAQKMKGAADAYGRDEVKHLVAAYRARTEAQSALRDMHRSSPGPAP